MKTQLAYSLILTAALSATALTANAKDYCIHGVGNVNVTYVAQQFKIPGPGKCAAWMGFCSAGCSPDNLQTGTACTSSDKKHVSFVITTAYAASNRQWDWVRLDLPAQTGSGNLNDLSSGIGGTQNYNATGGFCSTQPVPVP